MYGLINSALKSMINEQFSADTWEKILAVSNVPNESFMTMRSYDDQITYDLLGAASEVLALPADKCLELFGEYWVLESAPREYGSLLDACGANFIEFMSNLNTLHDRITTTFLDYRPPEFCCEEREGHHTVIYRSPREGLVPFVVGLLKGLATRFNCELNILGIEKIATERGTEAEIKITISSRD